MKNWNKFTFYMIQIILAIPMFFIHRIFVYLGYVGSLVVGLTIDAGFLPITLSYIILSCILPLLLVVLLLKFGGIMRKKGVSLLPLILLYSLPSLIYFSKEDLIMEEYFFYFAQTPLYFTAAVCNIIAYLVFEYFLIRKKNGGKLYLEKENG